MICLRRIINLRILGLAMPTNEPTTFRKFWLPYLDNIKEISPFTTCLFNFQSPWTDEEIVEVIKKCESKGFEVRYAINSYEIPKYGYVPFNKMRNDAAGLMPEAKFYMITDDDMSYMPAKGDKKSAGRQILECIHYLTKFPDCGLVLIGNNRDNDVEDGKISPVPLKNNYWNRKGIIFRNLGTPDEHLFPKESLKLYGSCEEKVCSGARLAKGWYPAKIKNGSILHTENLLKCSYDGVELEKDESKVSCGLVYGWGKKEIVRENNLKFIKENYCYNAKNENKSEVVSKSLYFSNGGINVYDAEVVESRTINYKDYDLNTLLEEVENGGN